MTEDLKPKNHAEEVAMFRYDLVGGLCSRDLNRGDVRAELKRLAALPVRPPGSEVTRCFAFSTYEGWLYNCRKGGMKALMPQQRCDAGNGCKLNKEQRKLLLDIKRENPGASAALILRTLVEDGRLPRDLLSGATLRRIYKENGLSASQSRRLAGVERDRRRWVAARPDQLWHADVCHGPALTVDGKSVPLRIHAILDDHSRYVVAIQACSTEREIDMLSLLVWAWRGHGACEQLYLDNGSTYTGDALAIACSRLNVTLSHARPYDPQARGKMERFWRTLRSQCLDHMGPMSSLHDVQVRLLAWLDRHYLVAPHSSLVGRSPQQVYDGPRERDRRRLSEKELRAALVVNTRRKIGSDGTISIGGTLFEAKEGFLSGAMVTVCRTLAEPGACPWVEYEGRQLVLKKVDAVANSTRRRDTRPRRGIDAVPFDPPKAHVDRLLGKKEEDPS